MGSREFVDAAKVLVNSMSREEYEKMLTHSSGKYPDLFENKGFFALKNSKRVFGGVGKCQSFLPIGVQIEGWFLPTNNYDRIEVYCGNKFCGNAELGISRMDVYNNFPFFNEKKAGFSVFIEPKLAKSSLRDPITLIVKKGNNMVFKKVIAFEHFTVTDSVREIGNSLHTENNVLVPTLTNRMEMISEIAKKMPEYNFVTIVEGMETKLPDVMNVCKNKYNMTGEDLNRLSVFMAPKIFHRNYVPTRECIIEDGNVERMRQNNELLTIAATNFETKYNVSTNYALRYCYEAVQYAEQLIETVHPKMVMIWNQYSPWHQMLSVVAKSKGIPVVFMENGLLPGTLIFETIGQMGESYPARNSDEFMKLEVTDEEIAIGAQIRERLFANKLNRWKSTDASVYNDDEVNVVREKLKPGRPTILYAGQNDFESGLYPYTEHTKEFHSPVFESSEEAAVYLGKLAARNDWNLIYKRHPMMRGKMIANLPENVIVSDNIEIHDAIDIADLTITILSQTSYVAMIRNRPALMLGYHQLCHKDCIYEAHDKDVVESVIQEALDKGLTEAQKENFHKHIAQLCKYYLYADFLNPDIDYGKNLDDLAEYLEGVASSYCETSTDDCTITRKEEQEIIPETKLESKSEFYLELSYKERWQRHQIKNRIDKGELKSCLEECTELVAFNKNLMYISQMDGELLGKHNWNSIFREYLEVAISKGETQFNKIYDWIAQLNPEICRRLNIQGNLQQTIARQWENAANRRQVLLWSIRPDNEVLQKACMESLNRVLKDADEEMKEAIGETVRELFGCEEVTEREKIYLLELLHKQNLLSSEDVQLWNHVLMNSDDEQVLYYYGLMELDRICFLKPECRYPEYYEDRRKMLIHASEVLGSGRTWNKPAIDEDNRRIAMLVVGLHGKKFASTRLQVGLANEMARRGWKVTIFVADLNYINTNAEDAFVIPPETTRRNYSKTCFQREHWEILDVDVNVHYSMGDVNDKERYCQFMDAIYAFNPCAIIDITNEQAVYNPQLVKDYPVYSIPLNGYVSSAECNAYISRNIEMMKEEQKNFVYNPPQHVLEANLYLPYDIDKAEYKRESKGLARTDFITVTVGNRLDYEVTVEVQNSMKELLMKNPSMKWILVGKVNPMRFQILKPLIEKRQVILWGYENNLPALYKMCDVYLDMPRSGGGGSTALAVQSGIPAIIMDLPSDILPFLGKETCVEDWERALERLIVLKNSKKMCREQAKVQARNLGSSEWKVEHFVDVIEEAMKLA